MKKYFKLIIAVASSAALFAACAKEDNAVSDTPEIKDNTAVPATITVAIPEEGLTKVALEQDSDPDGVVKLTWEDTDAITVKNADDESKSVNFAYASGAGTATATFSAADVSALDGASSYNIYLTSDMPGGYAEQTQASNGSTAHLGYAATLSGVNKYDGATFSQTWASANGSGTLTSSSVLRIRAQMPTAEIADAVQKVIIKASANIFAGSDQLAVNITTPGVADDGKVVTVYATLPAGDVNIAADTELLFQFQVSGNAYDKYTAYRKLAATTLYGGKVNAFKLNCSNIDSYAGTLDDGTSSHPYLIADQHQLQAVHSLLSSGETKYIKLIDNIDLTGVSWTAFNDGSPYDCVAHFDGNGKTVSNLNAPLFYDLNGSVRDLTLSDASITVNKNGGVLARTIVTDGTISNVKIVDSEMSTNSAEGAGGLIGKITNTTEIEKVSVSNCTIQAKTQHSGGLVGLVQLSSDTSVNIAECCCVNSSVTSISYYPGGLVGNNSSSAGTLSISDSYASGSVSCANFAGGILGIHNSSGRTNITNCYSSMFVQATGWTAGGIVGQAAKAGLSLVRCMAFNSSIKASTSGARYSSGAIIGLGRNVDVVVNYCYRSNSIVFDCASTDNTTMFDMDFIDPAGKIPYTGTTNTLVYCHHGQETTSTLSTLVQDASKVGVAWSGSIWNFDGDEPVFN